VQTDVFDTLAMNPLAVALLGDMTRHTGLARSGFYRWFMDPAERLVYPEEAHERHGRAQAARLRAALTAGSDTPRAARIVAELQEHSPEFVRMWELRGVAQRYDACKTLVHPELAVSTSTARSCSPRTAPRLWWCRPLPRHGEPQQARTALRHWSPAGHPVTSWTWSRHFVAVAASVRSARSPTVI
jgi:hypothetical protein